MITFKSSSSSFACDIIGIPLLPPHFNSHPQKIIGAHSYQARKEKGAEERAMQRQNKQISKHFYIKIIKRHMR